MNAEMQQVMTEMKVPEIFQKWLVSQNIISFDDFVWAASNNSEMVDDEIIKASQIAFELKDKVPIRKAWYAASVKLVER